jgi:hypothetical protein
MGSAVGNVGNVVELAAVVLVFLNVDWDTGDTLLRRGRRGFASAVEPVAFLVCCF